MFDLQDEECRPARVLRRVWDNLEAAEGAGDRKAAYFKRNLRVIAAGGDGTVAWILGTIRQVRVQYMSDASAVCIRMRSSQAWRRRNKRVIVRHA